MNDMDSVLKRAFAEAHEPADDGFAVKVGLAVAQRERLARVWSAAYTAGMALAGAAVLYAAYVLALGYGQELLASLGIELARAQFGLHSDSRTLAQGANGLMQAMSASIGHIMLIAAALAGGGALAYRAVQE